MCRVQGEEWLRLGEPNYGGCACLAKHFQFYPEGSGEPKQVLSQKETLSEEQCVHFRKLPLAAVERGLEGRLAPVQENTASDLGNKRHQR